MVKIIENNNGTITAVDANIDSFDIDEFENKFMPHGITIDTDLWENTVEIDLSCCEDPAAALEAREMFERIIKSTRASAMPFYRY